MINKLAQSVLKISQHIEMEQNISAILHNTIFSLIFPSDALQIFRINISTLSKAL